MSGTKCCDVPTGEGAWCEDPFWHGRTCRDDNEHRWADEMDLPRLLKCEWGWHPGRDYRVPHVPSFTSEACQ